MTKTQGRQAPSKALSQGKTPAPPSRAAMEERPKPQKAAEERPKLQKQASALDAPLRQLQQDLLLERVQHGRTKQLLEESREAMSLESQRMQQEYDLLLTEVEALRQQEAVIVVKQPSWAGATIRALFFCALGAAATWGVLKFLPNKQLHE